jgi:outer membrane protein TolC
VTIAQALSLDSLLEQALGDNPEVLAAQSEWDAAKAKIPQVRWWPDPQFGISYEKIPEGSYSLRDARMRMFSISQTIPFPGKLTLKGRLAQSEALAAGEEYEAATRQVVAEVKSAYYSLFLAHKSIEIEHQRKELLQKLAKMAETKYAVGEVSQHDVLRAQVELSLSADNLITLQERELPTAEARLNGILNRPPRSPLGIPEEFSILEIRLTDKELEELTLEHRQVLKAMEYEMEKTRTAYSLAKMEYVPNFTVRLVQEEMDTPTGKEINRGVAASINLPVWFWTKNHGISEKRAKKSGAEASYLAMRNVVLFEVQSALARYRASRRRVSLFEVTVIPLAEQALKAATVGYETGKVDFLTLMDSERTLRDVKLRYYEALVQHGVDVADLERIVGATIVQ